MRDAVCDNRFNDIITIITPRDSDTETSEASSALLSLAGASTDSPISSSVSPATSPPSFPRYTCHTCGGRKLAKAHTCGKSCIPVSGVAELREVCAVNEEEDVHEVCAEVNEEEEVHEVCAVNEEEEDHEVCAANEEEEVLEEEETSSLDADRGVKRVRGVQRDSFNIGVRVEFADPGHGVPQGSQGEITTKNKAWLDVKVDGLNVIVKARKMWLKCI